ncbi:hypothetical protein GCM10010174_83050 [Kutzneria viridogrisea]|uniref:Uncharacterized protein n=2 Tax=Kutzneria TaxID=43356 RepID=W5WH90_9PSEU|nr:hypothetical protein KALB_6839 [Kutzneria albida DSM 43870]MBA8925374.1 hypothetical protein [Kutzneria viridogrisea]
MKVPLETFNVVKGTFMTRRGEDSGLGGTRRGTAMKVPLGTPSVVKGTFMT